MTEITPYKGRLPLDADIERFAAYVNGTPALMIEFYESHYHVYGPRAGSFSDILQVVGRLLELFRLPLNVYGFSCQLALRGREGVTLSGDIMFPQLEKQLYQFENAEHCAVSSNSLSVWADIGNVKNARSGMATVFQLPMRNIKFLRYFTSVELSDQDLTDIGAFVSRRTSGRYGR